MAEHEHEHEYITMTGAEFNEAYGKYEMIKILRRDLTHKGYTYEPNKLNKLRCAFNPDADCKPGGLYFCKSKHVFTHIEIALRPNSLTDLNNYPLVAKVEIPDDAIISVGAHKFKTNKLILGQPINIDTYITDEWILKRSSKKINTMLYHCHNMIDTALLKRAYPLCLYKHKIEPFTRLCILKAAVPRPDNIDSEFLANILRDMDVSNMSRSDYPVELYDVMCKFVDWIVRNGHLFAMKCCAKEGVPFILNNNSLLVIARKRDDWQMLKCMVRIGFDIDSTCESSIFIRTRNKTRIDRYTIDRYTIDCDTSDCESPTMLEIALTEHSLSHAKKLVKLGAQISKVNKAVLKRRSKDKKFAPFILDHMSF